MARYRKTRAVVDTSIPERLQFVLDAVHSDTQGCILWPWYVSSGYGMVWYCGYQVRCHRLAWCLANAQAEPQVVRHTCDNPRCINPRHLIPGTQADNMADMVARGRASKGSGRPSAKLNEAAVAIIRAEYVKGTPRGAEAGNSAELAARFGVSRQRISRIARGVEWK